jgi:hypothetical protein
MAEVHFDAGKVDGRDPEAVFRRLSQELRSAVDAAFGASKETGREMKLDLHLSVTVEHPKPPRPSGTDIVHAMMAGRFKPMTEADMRNGWAGMEGDGFEAVINDHHVVVDVAQTVFINIVAPDGTLYAGELGSLVDLENHLDKPCGSAGPGFTVP